MRILSQSRIGRARDRIVVRNAYDAFSNRSTFLVFILHTPCLFLEPCKTMKFHQTRKNDTKFLLFFGSHDDSLILVARDFSIQLFIAPDVESVRKFVV